MDTKELERRYNILTEKFNTSSFCDYISYILSFPILTELLTENHKKFSYYKKDCSKLYKLQEDIIDHLIMGIKNKKFPFLEKYIKQLSSIRNAPDPKVFKNYLISILTKIDEDIGNIAENNKKTKIELISYFSFFYNKVERIILKTDFEKILAGYSQFNNHQFGDKELLDNVYHVYSHHNSELDDYGNLEVFLKKTDYKIQPLKDFHNIILTQFSDNQIFHINLDKPKDRKRQENFKIKITRSGKISTCSVNENDCFIYKQGTVPDKFFEFLNKDTKNPELNIDLLYKTLKSENKHPTIQTKAAFLKGVLKNEKLKIIKGAKFEISFNYNLQKGTVKINFIKVTARK